MTAIWVYPDTEYFEAEKPLIFEVPGELHRKVTGTEPEEDRRGYFNRVFAEFATPAINQAKNYKGFEVLDGIPLAMHPYEIQEDPEDIAERTVKGVPKRAVTRAAERDTVFWAVVVKVRQKRRLFERYREVKGPEDGFEANDKMPDWMAHGQKVYDLKKDS